MHPKSSYHSRKVSFFTKSFDHSFAGEKLRKPRVLCAGHSFTETTCRVVTTHPCFWGHGSKTKLSLLASPDAKEAFGSDYA